MPNPPKSRPVQQTVFKVLQQDGWIVQFGAGEDVLMADYSGDNGEWTCLFLPREQPPQCVVLSQLDDPIPSGFREEVMRFITRANAGLAVGNFQLDLDDGTLRFRTSLDLTDGASFTPEQFRLLVERNVNTMDHFLPGLAAIEDEGFTAADALTQVP